MPVKTKSVYDKPEPSDGHRVLVMRYWPRGVSKSKVNAWEKELGTPAELIEGWQGGSVTWSEFVRQYRADMLRQGARIAALAEKAAEGSVTLLCGCRDDARCHRILLQEIINHYLAGMKRRPLGRHH